jgi:hypothetical protein
MTRRTSQHLIISIIILFAIVASLVSLRTAPSFTSKCPLQIMPSCATRSTQAERCRQEDEAMAAAILQKVKDAAKNDRFKGANEDNLNVAVDTNLPYAPLPLVVSPLSAPNLTSLLTGHIGQEVGTQADDNGIATDKGHTTHRRMNRSMTM